MKGIIIKIYAEQPYQNYVKIFGNPMQEQTLQLADNDNNTLSFYKIDDRIPVRNIMEGVTVFTSYALTENDVIRILLPPANLPKKLEKYIFPDLVQNITNNLNQLQIHENSQSKGPLSKDGSEADEEVITRFLTKYYTQGGMTSLSNMKIKPGWHNSFRNSLEIKQVHICKSCNNKARRGCCDKYGANNRKTLYMVLGWSDV